MNRVYITSFSAISAIGIGIEQSVKNLASQKQLIHYPSNDEKFQKPYFKINYQLDTDQKKIRCSQIALSLMSLVKEYLAPYNNIPIFLATSTGGIKETEDNFLGLYNNSINYPLYERHFFSKIIEDINEKYNNRFEDAYTISTACSSSGHSIMQAFEFIKHGIIDKALIIGVDALSLTTMVGFDSLKLVSEKGTKPLSKQRDGLSLGEGGGILLLESNPHVEPIAEIIGCSTSTDGYHISSPDPQGTQQKISILKALNDCKLNQDSIDYINAHGTGTVINDQMEMDVIKSIFPKGVVTTSTKSFIGHTLGASAVAEVAITLGMIKEKTIYQPDNMGEPIDSDYIPAKTIKKEVKYFLKNSFGFGGNNVSMIFRMC